MKRFSIPLGLALAALTVLTTGTPAEAGDRPFNASGGGTLDRDGVLRGTGEVMHLGLSSFRMTLDPDQLPNGNFFPGTGFFNSASRDVLYFRMESIEGDGSGALVFITRLTFIGGSGRFRDATGSADVMFVFDADFQECLMLIDGSIDY